MENLPKTQNDSTHLLAERADHREWIGGRAVTLLSHYWREDDPVELTAAIGKDWADVLEGLPREQIQKACILYQRDEPRKKPTPGSIYQIAKSLMPAPKVISGSVDCIKSGKPYLCTNITAAEARRQIELGKVTEDQCRKVGVL